MESREPAKVIWLNAAPTVKIEEATLDGRAGKILRGGEQFAGNLFENPVSAGKLRIRYTAAVSSKQSEGAFRVKDLDRWYLYTQFEPISARKVFPCFDEPNYKVPWQLTLEVPKQHSAFSNTPPVSEKTDGATKTIAFAKTRPLPSYLVAFAVGTFEIVPARAAGSRKIPMRIIVPAGRTAEAAYAAQVTPDILEQLENYFGIPYPYPKLDSIAVPLFPGAMENPGLITYGQTLILSKPSEDGIQRQRRYATSQLTKWDISGLATS